MASKAIQELVSRNQRLENAKKRERESKKRDTEKLWGGFTAAVSAGAAGYLDGRFDITKRDQVSGDGAHFFGVPVVPLVGLVMGVGGVAIGGKTGDVMMWSGIGTGCGWLYGQSAQKGREHYRKALGASGVDDDDEG